MAFKNKHNNTPLSARHRKAADDSAATPVNTAQDALTERIKELNCLYGISNLFENQDVSLSWIMQRAVQLIPAAWQYPEKACARIRIDGQEYYSKNFKITRWQQNTKIILNESHVGDVDVFYIAAPPKKSGPAFLEEEDRLLKAIGERLSKVLWLKRAEEALKESEARYRILTEQITEGVSLVQDERFYYVNPEFCRIFNLPAVERMHDEQVYSPFSENADEITVFFQSVPDSHVDAKVEEIHPLVRPQKTFWIEVCHNPIMYKGRPALLSTFKDITKIKEEQMAAQQVANSLNNENRILRSSLKDRYRLGNILGHTQVMQEIYELIIKAASTIANVAIFGESGSGKELVAHAIHENSSRKNHPFVAVNCSAIQETLFEREFFGHCKGAFSSAHADLPGYLDLADGGTLFLDEVADLSLNMQAKLLRAIEGGGYRPVGAAKAVSSDFRIISASNTSLMDKVAMGHMRHDFFYRIQVLQIQIPPLRQRKLDIPLLVEHFLREMGPSDDMMRVPGRIMDMLIEYDWPGNVRELRNVLQRYVTLGHLEFLTTGRKPEAATSTTSLNLKDAVVDLEKSLIARALQQTGGNRTRAAVLLGISRRALFRKKSHL